VELAARIAAGIHAANGAGRPYVLGCPGGRSPMPVYEALAAQLAADPMDCSRVIIAMMDEYLLAAPDGGLTPPPASAHYSCRGFGEREIIGRINAGLPGAYRIPAENFRMPDPAKPDAYDGRLADAGGIDLFLLASGAGDGHIASTLPAPRATARAVSSSLPSRRAATTSPPSPTSGRWMKCPRTASPSASRRSPSCRNRRR
jgi:glucosamine-6-phosphate deaminase